MKRNERAVFTYNTQINRKEKTSIKIMADQTHPRGEVEESDTVARNSSFK